MWLVLTLAMMIILMLMLVCDGEHSQRERKRVVNVHVVMPTRHVIEHVIRLGDRHGDSFNRQQSTCITDKIFWREAVGG